jgi:hypothetical protein
MVAVLIESAAVNVRRPFGPSLSKPHAPFDRLRASVQAARGRLNSAMVQIMAGQLQ